MVNRKPKGIIYETIPKTVFPCLVTPLRPPRPRPAPLVIPAKAGIQRTPSP